MPYREQVHGLVGLNYGKSPWRGGWPPTRIPPGSSAAPSTATRRRRCSRPSRATGYGSTSCPLQRASACLQPGGTPLAARARPLGHRYAQLAAAGRPVRRDPPSGQWRRGHGPSTRRPRLWRPSGAVSGCRAVGPFRVHSPGRLRVRLRAWSDRKKYLHAAARYARAPASLPAFVVWLAGKGQTWFPSRAANAHRYSHVKLRCFS